MKARATPILITLLCTSGCTSHLSIGRDYQSRNNFPLAVEYFDAGLEEDPGDEKLKDAFIIAEQTYQWRLRKQIDRLVESRSYLQAMTVLTELTERALRMEKVPLPGEDPGQLSAEYNQLRAKAISQLEIDLDSRGNRAYVLPSDLRACRQLLALGLEDGLVVRRCQQILNKLRLNADVQIAGNSYPPAFGLRGPLAQAILSANPELLKIVSSKSEERNATITLHVSPPVVNDTGWYISEHDAFHTWVHKLDGRGRAIKKTITTPPTREQVEAARKAGRKPPKPRKEKKNVWEEVDGAYTYYKNTRTVHLDYRVTVANLRDNSEVAHFTGTLTEASNSNYYTYSGNPRARKSVSGTQGRHNAAPLQTISHLVGKANRALPAHLGERILQRID